MEITSLTPASAALFTELAADAGNWSDMPLLGGNVESTAATRGNIADLKKKGLIITQVDEGNTWVLFTALGSELALQLGHKVQALGSR